MKTLVVMFLRMSIIICMMSLLLLPAPGTSKAGVDHSPYSKVDQCLKCHPKTPPTHRRKRPQAMTEDLPLDAEGLMVCITCHDCISGVCHLRKEGKELCMVCHDCTEGMACVIGAAHLGDKHRVELTACMGCHDGSIGPDKGGAGQHGIDIVYIPSSRKRLKPITDSRVVLVDGRVTCVSCHNPYSSDGQRLSRSNEGSGLCLVCHRR